MIDQPLETTVWHFPIYKYGTKKYIPLMYALPIAYILPTILIVVLSPFSYTNALLFQLEYIFIALMYGSLGILTRSKLRSLLNIIPAALSYMTVEFAIQGLFNFNPPINDPYAGFNIASAPLASILSTANLGNLSFITQYLFLLDILIILVLAELGGFFTAMISTGFWNPKGQFSILAVIAKIIAIPFALIFIIMIPLALHGVVAVLDGTAYIGAGVSEMSTVFTGSGGTAAGVSINNISIPLLEQRSKQAAQYFNLANAKFQQLKGNILLEGVLGYVTSTVPGLQGFSKITNALDLIGSITEVTYVIPNLFLGFKALETGFNETVPFITSASTTYNPTFKDGLLQLTYAFNNFSLAWQTTDNSTHQTHGIKNAIDIASSLKQITALNSYVNINEFINALDIAITSLLTIKNAFVQFMNGTYETSIGMVNLANNNLAKTNYWIDQAINEFTLSNATLSAIPTPPTVSFQLYPDGKGGNGKIQTIPIPIDGVINIAKDMNNLLIRFAYAGLSSINLFDAMDSVMTSMGNLNWTDASTAANPTYWNNLTSTLLVVQDYYNYGYNNLTKAAQLAQIDGTKSYGSLLDPVFVTGPHSFFNLLSSQITKLTGNYTDFSAILQGFTNTTYAMEYFSYGSEAFNVWFADYTTNSNTSNTVLADAAKTNFTISANYAYNGYLALQNTVNMNPTVKQNWESKLYDPVNNGTLSDQSLSGADYMGIYFINNAGSVVINQNGMVSIVINLQLGNVLT